MGESEYRGAGGPIAITTNPNRMPLTDAFIAAGNSLQLRTKEDQNGPDLEALVMHNGILMHRENG
jgi:hypothetical protein